MGIKSISKSTEPSKPDKALSRLRPGSYAGNPGQLEMTKYPEKSINYISNKQFQLTRNSFHLLWPASLILPQKPKTVTVS